MRASAASRLNLTARYVASTLAIGVTASSRAQALQAEPAIDDQGLETIIVLTADDLQPGIDSGANDILANIPNVTATGTGNFSPAIRGVDGTGPASGAEICA